MIFRHTGLDRRAQAALRAGKYVSRVNGNDVYVESGMYEKLRAASKR